MNIKVITGYEGECLYKDIAVTNLQEYSNRHGYTFIAKFNDWKESDRYFYWRKLEMILDNIESCDYLVWIDTDCIVTNQTKKIEDLVEDDFDLVITEDDGLQASVMILKNTLWCIELLHEWWDMGNIRHSSWKELHDKGGNDRASVFTILSNDNTVLHKLLSLNNSISARIKRVGRSELVTKHVHFNSDIDNFIVHIPGSTEEDKLQFLTKFLQQITR